MPVASGPRTAYLVGAMIATFTTLVIGFSIWSAAILLFAYIFFLPSMRKTLLGTPACAVLLGGLVVLQLGHLQYLDVSIELFELRLYVAVLLTTPVAFYFFSREVLLPAATRLPWLGCHLILPIIGSTLPTDIAAEGGLSFRCRIYSLVRPTCVRPETSRCALSL